VLNNIDKFQCNPGHLDNLMRDREGIYITWKTIEYFRPKSILEIGFGCGETLGIMLEAAGPELERIVSNDIRYTNTSLEQFETLFPKHTVEFIETPSSNLKLDGKFDFIMIDGDHSFDTVLHDIQMCLKLSHTGTIMCIDDYQWESVDQAIRKSLDTYPDFVPFLATTQQIFFHYATHSAADFLDQWLIKDDGRFIEYSQRLYLGHSISYGHLYDVMFKQNNEIFLHALRFYNL
jgi:predicted O-methyltransferase YrrM